jgi:isocitrate dehydrogenase kinase/phosphatase
LADVQAIARTILDGFERHYRLFREVSARAVVRFEEGRWLASRHDSSARIGMYDQRVEEAVRQVTERHPEARDEGVWPSVKLAYIVLLYEHRQPECAETFFNSVACRVLHRRYYNNACIFARPAVATEHLVGEKPAFRSYYPRPGRLRTTLRAIAADLGLLHPFADLAGDLRRVLRAFRGGVSAGERHPNLQIQVLSSLFVRGRSAYVIGRVLDGSELHPFAVPLVRAPDGGIRADALLLRPEHIGPLFSLARSYFMADFEVPSACVEFLQSLLPGKPRAELYTAIGLQKQGKTLFYRDLQAHLAHSADRFVEARGTRGMVMVVFTLPSFPYVFKLIRDAFAPPKEVTEAEVRERYFLVKHHDRVGRMADTLEYSDVALPLHRFEPSVLDLLDRLAPSRVERDGDRLVIRHCYIERRLVPLDVWLRSAAGDEAKLRHGIQEFGDAVRAMAEADIFPGDLLPKNFGVTRYGRVVFYDYDEICPVTECRFRRLPARDVEPRDIFPEELPRFLFPAGPLRGLFLALHADLATPEWWHACQARLRAGTVSEPRPYPEAVRFPAR